MDRKHFTPMYAGHIFFSYLDLHSKSNKLGNSTKFWFRERSNIFLATYWVQDLSLLHVLLKVVIK